MIKKIKTILLLIGVSIIGAIIAYKTSYSITAIATYALVCVTGYYAIGNWRILEEMRRERKINYLERQLRQIYSPLRSHIVKKDEKYSFDFPLSMISTQIDFDKIIEAGECYDKKWVRWFMETVQDNSHLINTDVRDRLLSLKYDIYEPATTIETKYQATFHKIVVQYEKLCEELRKLTE